MFNFMIVYSKNTGLPLDHLGEDLPRGYPDHLIAGLAYMSVINSMNLEEVQKIEYKDFTLYLTQNGPYAEVNNGTIVTVIQGNHVDAAVSINKEKDLIPASDTFKSYDYPRKDNGLVEHTPINIFEQLIQQHMRSFDRKQSS